MGKAKKEITKELFDKLTASVELPDDDEMMPVAMSAVGSSFDRSDGVDGMCKYFGPQGASEALVKAFEYYEEHERKIPEDQRSKVMTSKEFNRLRFGEEKEKNEGATGETAGGAKKAEK